MDIDKLQQSHREAVLHNLATGELNPLEHQDAVFGEGSVSATRSKARPAPEAGYGDPLVRGATTPR